MHPKNPCDYMVKIHPLSLSTIWPFHLNHPVSGQYLCIMYTISGRCQKVFSELTWMVSRNFWIAIVQLGEI